MTPTTTEKVHCPKCNKTQVVLFDPHYPTIQQCLDCRHIWQEEVEREERHKRRKEHEG